LRIRRALKPVPFEPESFPQPVQAVRKCFEMNSGLAVEVSFRLEPALFPQPV
jgi:hypothetical protein